MLLCGGQQTSPDALVDGCHRFTVIRACCSWVDMDVGAVHEVNYAGSVEAGDLISQ